MAHCVAMKSPQARIDELHQAWEHAVERDKHADAVKALVELEQLEPKAEWAQRLGEAYRRLHKMKEAEDAFVRAMERFNDKGFTPRAIAMAKLVQALNPARTDLIPSLAPTPAAPPRPRAVPPPLPRPKPAPLERAPDAKADEVRFSDAPEPSSIEIVLEDVSGISNATEISDVTNLGSGDVVLVSDSMIGRAAGRDPTVRQPLDELPEPMEPSIDRYATMSVFRLFAGLSRDALVALSLAAELVEFVPTAMIVMRDEPAFALYAIIDGVVRVQVRGLADIRLGEGDVFGEGCLLGEGVRQANVKAETAVMALRIGKNVIDKVSAEHAEVNDALFELLARRLVSNLMTTSPLFTLFEPKVRLELAQMFEIRRAAPGTILSERGRRSDGLYVLLAGNVMAKGDGAQEVRMARGTAFGHGSLMGDAPAMETIRVASEAVLLRLPATKFAALAASYPPVLAALSETANDPVPPSRLLE
jgi:CRP-like cAMP-binding protein